MIPDLRFERLLPAVPDRAFELFTSPVGQHDFYGNDARGWVVESSCELAVGGVWEIVFGPSRDELYRHRHVIEVLDPPHLLSLATTESRPDGSTVAFRTEFTFAPRDGSTLMTMVQSGFPTQELRNEHGHGLPHAFDRLERSL